jgi:hypothetical protein
MRVLWPVWLIGKNMTVKKTPSKIWTQKKFNKVKFQDVNELFLRKLKINN